VVVVSYPELIIWLVQNPPALCAAVILTSMAVSAKN
jgi:hypothetical protein